MPRNRWSNRLAFILTTAAFAVGLGNVWRFPYIVGEGGGGAFLLIYVVLILLIGIPILTIEIGLGRLSGTTPLVGYGKLSKRSAWNGLGWLEVISNILILNFYVMILAWIAIYFFESVTGKLSGIPAEALTAHFDAVASDLGQVLAVIGVVMITALGIVYRGLQAGLERYAQKMMIALVLMMLGLAAWAATLDGAVEGYRWYLSPDFSKINLEVILMALGQVFFSVGVGMAIAFAFGSYTDASENLLSSTAWIVLADTLFAILAGLMIFPALFSFGLSPDAGPNLIFVTMATVFSHFDYGNWIGGVFFLLLFLAGFTSLISSLQGLKDSFSDKYSLSADSALLLVSSIVTVGAVPVVFSYAPDPVQLFGFTVFGLLDYMTNTLLLPLGGLLIVVFGAYVVGFSVLRSHLQAGAERVVIGDYWNFIIKWVIPAAMVVLLLHSFL